MIRESAALSLYFIPVLIITALVMQRWARNIQVKAEESKQTTDQISETLKVAESKFRQVVESNIIGTFFYRHDGTIRDANDSFLKMLGYVRADIESGIFNWRSLTPPEWVEVDNEQLQFLIDKKFIGYEKEFFHKNGHRVPVFLSASDLGPQVDEGISFAIDLTEQKRAEKALALSEERNSVATSLVGVGTWEWSFVDNALTLSEISSKLFGFDARPRILTLEQIAERINPEDFPRVQIEGAKSLVSGEDSYIEFRVVTPDGSLRWLALRGRAVLRAEGPPEKCVGVHFDITAQKLTEEALRASEMRMKKTMHEAQAANQMKDEFLATLSHELRTPLNAILGWSELMQTADRQAPLFNRAIETIQRNAKLQCEMINDLLDMARILNGKFSIAVKEIDLGSILMDAVESCRLSAQVKEIDVHVDLDFEGIGVLGDPNRLQQIMWNLLNNAIKFTPKGGVVKIAATHDGQTVSVRVDDSGEGIPSEFLPFVFDRFRQADASTSRRHGGLGLGLAIVRHLVELHGGTVHAESLGSGKGSSFQIRLPILQSEPIQIEPLVSLSKLDEASLAKNTACLVGKKILIVDDVRDSLEYAGQVLTLAESDVHLANSGAEALEMLNRETFDLMLTDLGMPVIDGFNLLKRVRARESDLKLDPIPVVALTAYARESDFAKTKEAGFHAHLAKPVSPAKLYKTLTNVFMKGQPDDQETIRTIGPHCEFNPTKLDPLPVG